MDLEVAEFSLELFRKRVSGLYIRRVDTGDLGESGSDFSIAEHCNKYTNIE